MKKLSGKPWSYGLLIFYTCFVTAVIGFAIFALRQKVELVSKDYYADELAFQDHIDSIERTKKLEHPPRWNIDKKERHLSLTFHSPIKSGDLKFYRPSDSTQDRDIPLELDENNQFVLNLHDYSAGPWRAQLSWSDGQQDYFQEQVLVLE